jgi:hypothetical protein
MQKKILLAFDLNCLLGYIAPKKNFMKENSLINEYLPHKVHEGYNVWLRPNLDILFRRLFYQVKNFILFSLNIIIEQGLL